MGSLAKSFGCLVYAVQISSRLRFSIRNFQRGSSHDPQQGILHECDLNGFFFSSRDCCNNLATAAPPKLGIQGATKSSLTDDADEHIGDSDC